MFYWVFERPHLVNHLKELESQKKGEGLTNDAKYLKRKNLDSDIFQTKTKINFNSIVSSTSTAGIVVSAAYMASDNMFSIVQLNESFNEIVNSLSTISAPIVALGVAKLGMDLYKGFGDKFKDSNNVRDFSLEQKKAKIVKEYFTDNETISKMEIEDLIGLGSCYTHLKKESQKNKNTFPESLYKGFMKVKHKEKNEYKALFDFIDKALDEPIVKEYKDFYHNFNTQDKNKSSKSKVNEDVFQILETTIDKTYNEYLVDDCKKRISLFLHKSKNDKEYFDKNKESVEATAKLLCEKGYADKHKDPFFSKLNKALAKKNVNKLAADFNREVEKALSKKSVNSKNFVDTVQNQFRIAICDDISQKDLVLKFINNDYKKEQEFKHDKSISAKVSKLREKFTNASNENESISYIFEELNDLNENNQNLKEDIKETKRKKLKK